MFEIILIAIICAWCWYGIRSIKRPKRKPRKSSKAIHFMEKLLGYPLYYGIAYRIWPNRFPDELDVMIYKQEEDYAPPEPKTFILVDSGLWLPSGKA